MGVDMPVYKGEVGTGVVAWFCALSLFHTEPVHAEPGSKTPLPVAHSGHSEPGKFRRRFRNAEINSNPGV